MDYKVACCLCVRDCEKYLPLIFKNLDKLSLEFKQFVVIFAYDNCRDNSEKLLREYKESSNHEVIIRNVENNEHSLRTVRIAKARNTCLKIIYTELKDIDFHMMIDADDVNTKNWNINIIKKYLNDDTWDILTFNRDHYYDIWALSFNFYKHHCWCFINRMINLQVIDCMQKEIINCLKNLKKDELFECNSAFCGLGIYRTNKLNNIFYNGFYPDFRLLITDEERAKTIQYLQFKLQKNIILYEGNPEICEHQFYNILAIKKNNARVRIAKEIAIPNK